MKPITSNIAKVLGFFSNKDNIAKDNDADILIFNDFPDIVSVIAKGKIMIRNGEIINKGVYEG